jgi:hypothetical protein
MIMFISVESEDGMRHVGEDDRNGICMGEAYMDGIPGAIMRYKGGDIFHVTKSFATPIERDDVLLAIQKYCHESHMRLVNNVYHYIFSEA